MQTCSVWQPLQNSVAIAAQLQYQLCQNQNVELEIAAAKTSVERDMMRSIVVSREGFSWIVSIFWSGTATSLVTCVRTDGMCSGNVTVVVENEMFYYIEVTSFAPFVWRNVHILWSVFVPVGQCEPQASKSHNDDERRWCAYAYVPRTWQWW